MATRPRIVVIGGGVTGLVAARELASAGDVTVYDTAPSFGGKVQTATFRDRPVDLGPDAFITRNDAAERLCREIGLGDKLVAPAVSSAAIYARGALRPFPRGLVIGIPTNFVALMRSKIVSPRGLLRAFADFVPTGQLAPRDLQARAELGTLDPSVAELVGSRLGKEVLDVVVDPLIGGINASDVGSLSFAAALPQLVERLGGRRRLAAALRRPDKPAAGSATNRPEGSGRATKPIFYGLEDGLGQLIDALVGDCRTRGVTLSPSTGIEAIEVPSSPGEPNERYIVHTGAGAHQADALVFATPAFVTAALLGPLDARLAELCAEIPYAGVATVTMSWARSTLTTSLSRRTLSLGAGVLIPRRYGHLTTAASFTSAKWPAASHDDEFVIRASVGRHGDERWRALDNDELLAAVRSDLSSVLGIDTAPNDALVVRWERAFPQYTVGHLHRVAEIDARAAQLAGVSVAGAGYHGIGLPACIDSAKKAAKGIRAQLGT